MDVTISTTDTFLKNVKHLAKKYRSLKMDLQNFRDEIIKNPYIGTDLGNGMRKIRMAIASKGKGKSGGARVITYNVIELGDNVHVVLLTIYDKSEKENISDKELEDIRKETGL